jgi:uncharacterized membrane protein YraQ (UPF0718 family)
MFAANLIAKDMFEIIGEWLLDITKYVITALVLTRIFDVLPNRWEATALAAVVALTVGAVAVYMINKKNKNNNKNNKKNKNIHNKKK